MSIRATIRLGEEDVEQKIKDLNANTESLVINKSLFVISSTLSHCGILLAAKVQNFAALTVIDCTGSWLTSGVSLGISQIMRACALKALHLNYNSLGNGARLIFEALIDKKSKSRNSLEVLELKENGISDGETWKILFDLLQKNKIITEIDVSDNYVPECVFKDLADAIEQNDTITEFNFRRKLGDWVARGPFDNVCEFCPLPDSVGKNQFTDDAFIAKTVYQVPRSLQTT